MHPIISIPMYLELGCHELVDVIVERGANYDLYERQGEYQHRENEMKF